MFGAREVIWSQGHGHRLEIHKARPSEDSKFFVHARTMGNGSETDAVPMTPKLEKKVAQSELTFADNRMRDAGKSAGYPGFATLVFDGAELTIEYHALSGTNGAVEVVFRERFTSSNGNVEGPEVLCYRTDPGFIFQELPVPVPACAGD